jgi:hypothetical protein
MSTENDPIELSQFLQSVPPGSSRAVSIHVETEGSYCCVQLPPIWIHCPNKTCNSHHWYDPNKQSVRLWMGEGVFNDVETWKYTCRHCRISLKTFSLLVSVKQPRATVRPPPVQVAQISKVGELPAFGVPASASLKGFLGDDAELFEKGRKSEAQGLGIGSFTYYRRIVDNQKTHLISAVRQVSEMEGGANAGLVTALDSAEKAEGFTGAYEALRGHIPASLRISGHDPLQLLYDQTSHGLHNLSDADCLARAATIREVLAAMAARVQELLRSHR